MSDYLFVPTIDWDGLVKDGKIKIKPDIKLPMETYKSGKWKITAPNIRILRESAVHIFSTIIGHMAENKGAEEIKFVAERDYPKDDIDLDIAIVQAAQFSGSKRGSMIGGVRLTTGARILTEKSGRTVVTFKLIPSVSEAVYDYAQWCATGKSEGTVTLNYWDMVAAIVKRESDDMAKALGVK